MAQNEPHEELTTLTFYVNVSSEDGKFKETGYLKKKGTTPSEKSKIQNNLAQTFIHCGLEVSGKINKDEVLIVQVEGFAKDGIEGEITLQVEQSLELNNEQHNGKYRLY